MDKMHMIAQFSSSEGSFYFDGDDKEFNKWGNRGDQTGTEANIRNFTDGRGSGGWGHVYRVLDESVREKMAQIQMAQCMNGYMGYNQGVTATRYKNRGSILRAMCAAQLGIDLDDWHDNGFGYFYGEKETDGNYDGRKMNMAKIDLRTLSPWLVSVECGTDCSMSVMAAFNIATNLWRHACYTPGNSYTRYMDTQPSGTFNMSGGGWQMAKLFQLFCAGKESAPVCSSSFKNKTLPCDYEPIDEKVPFSDVDRIKELGYDMSNYGDNAANPGFAQKYIIVRHVGFRFGSHDREKTYRFQTNSCYMTSDPNTPMLDANGKRIRQVMYAYGCGVQHSETTSASTDIPDDGGDGGQGGETGGQAGDDTGYSRVRVWYEPCMKQYIAAADGETLLAAQYDSEGSLVGWKNESTSAMPWQSVIHCKTWDGAPMVNVYASVFEQYKAVVKNDATVSPVRRVSAVKAVKKRKYDGTPGDWTAISATDPNREFCLIGGYTANPMSYDIGNTSKCGTLKGWTRNESKGTFVRNTKHYMFYRRGYDASVDADLSSAYSTCYMKVLPLTSSDGTTTIWAYFASDGNATSDRRRGNVCWVQKEGTPGDNDNVFPFFAVDKLTVDSGGSFTYGEKLYTFPASFRGYDPETNKGGFMYYYVIAESTGTYYYHWTHSYTDEDGQTVTENYVQDWATNSTPTDVLKPEDAGEGEGSSASTDPATEYNIVWRKRLANGTWTDKETVFDESTEETVEVDIKPPFGDGATKDESDGANDSYDGAVHGTLLTAISSPVNLVRGDMLLTRGSNERTAASSGGHVAMYI